jgi:hypothetical protein
LFCPLQAAALAAFSLESSVKPTKELIDDARLSESLQSLTDADEPLDDPLSIPCKYVGEHGPTKSEKPILKELRRRFVPSLFNTTKYELLSLGFTLVG